jgi:NADH-quinone oxidoreductase subunit G
MTPTVIIDGTPVPVNGHRNLLELIRSSGVELPTFCYCSDLSVYGACRMCVVEVEGRGLQTACSTPPEDGMVVRTTTQATQRIRKMALELLLANHQGQCQTCDRNMRCRLQALADRLGVRRVRFEAPADRETQLDEGVALVRDPAKCILCGDCVRMCSEVQGIGVLDFAGRGSNVRVTPAFGRSIDEVECVYCGQCAAICPTGAITVRSAIDDVWKAIHDPARTVVVQIAPAVRAALAQHYGIAGGEHALGKTVTALRRIGFDRVFDTSFAADLTTVEEGAEFLRRRASGGPLPMFTSCCPAWVKYAEQFQPDLLGQLSTCRSPQQMFGALARKRLPADMGIRPEDLYVVSVMPCSAKKFEAARPEFAQDGRPDVDAVLTTQELIRMIDQAGLKPAELPAGSLDLPFGFKTGAGVLFGASGGVAEAVLRLLAGGKGRVEFREVRGLNGLKEAELELDGRPVRVGVVSGLGNARALLEEIRAGLKTFDLVEVMACPGGCVGGAGQPWPADTGTRRERAEMLYDCDAVQPLHNAADNPFVSECLERIGGSDGHAAHNLLHTGYRPRRRIDGQVIELDEKPAATRVPVSVCIGTNCYIRGSYDTLKRLMEAARRGGLEEAFDFQATFCFENCKASPNVRVGEEIHGGVTPEEADEFFRSRLLPLADGRSCAAARE